LGADVVHITRGSTELFVDDALIASKQGVTRTLHPGVKHAAPVMAPDADKPWEHGGEDQSRRVHLYGTVMYDAAVRKYRMWYMCRMGPRSPGQGHHVPGLYIPRADRNPSTHMGAERDAHGRKFLDNDRGDLTCYAESDDGLTWTKPNLGIFEFDGSLDNNIVWDLHGASVFRDDDEADPAKRYKAIGFCRRYRSVFLLTSPDGLRWSDADHLDPVVERENEGSFNVVCDEVGKVYRAYAHARDGGPDSRRMVWYTQSPTLAGAWESLRPMLAPSPRDDARGAEQYGAIRAEIHNMSGFRYGSVHMGIAGLLYVTGDGAAEDQMPVDGPIDGLLISSRDGVQWDYPCDGDAPILQRGAPGSFDAGMIMGTATRPIIEGDHIHWYYTGASHTHGRPLRERHKAIGRATWRLDGFVSLDAGDAEGVVDTAPLRLDGDELEVNADVSRGWLRVEALSPDGHVLPGFSRHDCAPLAGDSTRHRVRWGSRRLADARQPVRLRFVLRNAELYAYRGANGSG
jgi:hypothetical protein